MLSPPVSGAAQRGSRGVDRRERSSVRAGVLVRVRATQRDLIITYQPHLLPLSEGLEARCCTHGHVRCSAVRPPFPAACCPPWAVGRHAGRASWCQHQGMFIQKAANFLVIPQPIRPHNCQGPPDRRGRQPAVKQAWSRLATSVAPPTRCRRVWRDLASGGANINPGKIPF
jgi:hypothetical protein